MHVPFLWMLKAFCNLILLLANIPSQPEGSSKGKRMNKNPTLQLP